MKNIMTLFLCLMFLSACSSSKKKDTNYTKIMNSYEKKSWNNPNEVKALWIVRTHIKTKENIDKIILKMKDYGFNTAIVQVRGLSDVLYKSKMEPQADEIEEGLDPLQYFIDQAKLEGIRVQAWLNVNMLSKPSFIEKFSKADTHLSVKKPEWVLRDKEGISMLSYKQDQLEADWMDGAYANPADKDWRKYFLRIVAEVQDSYDIEGIHLDFIRYPYAKDGGKYFGLDELHISKAQKSFSFSKEDYLENPQYLKIIDMIKMQEMNNFVREISIEVKKNNPKHILTAAVWAHRKKVYESVFQDWPFWLKKSYIDQAYMMIYVKDGETHDKRIEEFYDESYLSKLVIGMGIYRKPSWRTLKRQIDSSRALGSAGFCFFSAQSFYVDEEEAKIPKEKIKAIMK